MRTMRKKLFDRLILCRKIIKNDFNERQFFDGNNYSCK